ncbi:MAG TPA: hypothetical protein VGY54_20210 [Polyangiaceae bacterium]|nr:hypothetical protein [Polyangiaceae bacterium]
MRWRGADVVPVVCAAEDADPIDVLARAESHYVRGFERLGERRQARLGPTVSP